MELHITNGDATGELLNASDAIDGELLCWRDVLHDGPLLAGDVERYEQARARFLAALVNGLRATAEGKLEEASVLADFQRRRSVLDGIDDYEQVTLWFEHDLYDQLQLIEILKELDSRQQRLPPCYLICIGEHPEVPFFHGLGNLTPGQLAGLSVQRRSISASLLRAGTGLWKLLTAAEPTGLADWLDRFRDEQTPEQQLVARELPFMAAALLRFAREFPASDSGLTLTRRLLLEAVASPPNSLPALLESLKRREAAGMLVVGQTAERRYRQILDGPASFQRLFLTLQEREEAPFMGDLWVRKELAVLCEGEHPLLTMFPGSDPANEQPLSEPEYRLTANGRAVLAGKHCWPEGREYDLWRGGVHITSAAPWFWDDAEQRFCR